MARQKRQNLFLKIAQTYLRQQMPAMRGATLKLRMLDGPPGSPRYAVTAETCGVAACPHGIAPSAAAIGECPVSECPRRHSVRLLLDRQGVVMHTTIGSVHWM